MTLWIQNRVTLTGFLALPGLTFQNGGVGDQTGLGILPESSRNPPGIPGILRNPLGILPEFHRDRGSLEFRRDFGGS